MAFQINKIKLKPFSNQGTLHITHRVKISKSCMWLTPSYLSTSIYIGCSLIGYALLISAIYFLFIVSDLIAAFALSVGGFTLCLIVKHSGSNRITYQLNGSQRLIYGLEQPIPFDDIQQVELLKKTIHSSPDNPFQSGEICISTLDNKRYLLVEGADPSNMKAIAIALAEYIDTPLAIDETLNRV